MNNSLRTLYPRDRFISVGFMGQILSLSGDGSTMKASHILSFAYLCGGINVYKQKHTIFQNFEW